MKIFKRKDLPNNRRRIYFCGLKLLSYRKRPPRFLVPHINTRCVRKEIACFHEIGTNARPRKPKIIVSMTSIPTRIREAQYVVFSLLTQTVKPDEIILWLGHDKFLHHERDLPKSLLNLRKYGLTIKWCRDIGPHTKLIPAVIEYPNDIVITVDDDIYYPNNLVEKLYSAYQEHPNMIHCMRAHKIAFNHDGTIAPYDDWEKEIQNVAPGFNNFATGVGGVLYPPHCLAPEVMDKELFMNMTPSADDIWFWAMAVKKKTKINVVNSDYRLTYINPKRELHLTGEKTLASINILNNGNDIQMRAIMNYFKLPVKNTTDIKVSIIVPVYNVEKFLPKCLDSITNQTLKEIEIICINDGSTDKSESILNKYAKSDRRIKIITQKNMGLAGARNTGIAAANGEYICFVDSDDWIDADWCEKLYTAATTGHADIARGMIYNEFPNKTEPHEFNPTIERFADNNLHLGKNNHCVVVWDGIYKRTFLTNRRIIFIPGLVHEDIPFTAMTTYFANKTVPIADTFYHYRQKRLGQLSERNMKSVDGTFWANHYATLFINSVKYDNEQDYIDAIKRIIWRMDDTFIYATQHIADFSDKLRKRYFFMWRDDLKECKHLNKYRKMFPWLRYVIRGNMEKYIKYRTKR